MCFLNSKAAWKIETIKVNASLYPFVNDQDCYHLMQYAGLPAPLPLPHWQEGKSCASGFSVLLKVGGTFKVL